MFIDNEIYKYFTRYHISYRLNGRTSAVLHCIEKPKRHFETLNADSNGGFSFALRKNRAMPRQSHRSLKNKIQV